MTRRQNTSFDFGDSRKPNTTFTLYENIISDRGSHYSVSLGLVQSRQDITNFLTRLKNNPKYKTATHNSWAVRISHAGTIYESKHDDGEVGAGMVILRVMQKENIVDCLICVTRWFGGTKLMNDRFKHLQDATQYGIDKI